MATISLNLIMKNESKVILRLLESVYPLLDCYVIVDTGSEDDSVQKVFNFFNKKNIPGKILRHDFINFEDARNFALSNLSPQDADFGFWIDADEQLLISPNFDIAAFKKDLDSFDQGTTLVSMGGSKFGRRNFFRTSKPFYWKGKVHEMLLCKEPLVTKDIEGLEILVSTDGHSWSQGTEKKYLRHAEILLLEVQKDPDPRDVFYLAQSYRDAGDNKKALLWYKKRAAMETGFFEERYYAQFMTGVLLEALNAPVAEILRAYLLASTFDNMRAEHFLNAILVLQRTGEYESALLLSTEALKFHQKNPYPQRLLFIDEATYSHKLLDVHNLNLTAIKQKNMEENPNPSLEDVYEHLCSSPSDINEHLPILRKYASEFSRITEFGVRWGVSSYALLCGKPKSLVSYDVNFHECALHLSNFAKDIGVEFHFYKASVLDISIAETDVLFIDTLHTYSQLKAELALHAEKVKEAIIFHDTTTFGYEDERFQGSALTGLRPAIEEFLSQNENWTIAHVFENNNGLTILERPKANARRIKF